MNRSDRERETQREREMNRHEPLAFDLLKSLVVLRTACGPGGGGRAV